ncbi:hypothetical protein ZWY2020_010707 [Hordeum vulgare]|nr:hypothetical protein ZWY2020_010707 [Hordeum vulgare]
MERNGAAPAPSLALAVCLFCCLAASKAYSVPADPRVTSYLCTTTRQQRSPPPSAAPPPSTSDSSSPAPSSSNDPSPPPTPPSPTAALCRPRFLASRLNYFKEEEEKDDDEAELLDMDACPGEICSNDDLWCTRRSPWRWKFNSTSPRAAGHPRAPAVGGLPKLLSASSLSLKHEQGTVLHTLRSPNYSP